MDLIFVRPARPDDGKTFLEWAKSTLHNEMDPAVFTYPTTTIRCAYDETGPLMYLPVQRPLVMESLATRTGLDNITSARALAALLQDVVSTAYAEGSGEIYFVATEETIPKLAVKHGFEKLPWSIYRLRVNSTEKK